MIDTIWKVSASIKNFGKIKLLESKHSHDGASYYGDSSYARGRNARRDSMGRYSGEMDYSEDGYSEDDYSEGMHSRSYSRHDAKNSMMHKLGEMMRVASSDEKKILEDAMKKLDRV